MTIFFAGRFSPYLCGQGAPKYIQKVGCQYQFVWETSAACPSAAFSLGDCTVEDPSSGVKYDLAPLVRPAGYEVQGRGSHTYLVNLCAPLKVRVCQWLFSSVVPDRVRPNARCLQQSNKMIVWYVCWYPLPCHCCRPTTLAGATLRHAAWTTSWR